MMRAEREIRRQQQEENIKIRRETLQAIDFFERTAPIPKTRKDRELEENDDF